MLTRTRNEPNFQASLRNEHGVRITLRAILPHFTLSHGQKFVNILGFRLSEMTN
jgi:hypothetical protein